MGRRGPAKEPDAAKLTRGITAPSRLSGREPLPRARLPVMPAGMSDRVGATSGRATRPTLAGRGPQGLGADGSTYAPARHPYPGRAENRAEPSHHRPRPRHGKDPGEHRKQQLEERLAACDRYHGDDYVFATNIGTATDHRNLVRAFHAALERAGVPRQSFHQLRHASATLGIDAGESLYEVSRRLGHANISTTADIYGHLTPASTRRSADRMRDVLAG